MSEMFSVIVDFPTPPLPLVMASIFIRPFEAGAVEVDANAHEEGEGRGLPDSRLCRGCNESSSACLDWADFRSRAQLLHMDPAGVRVPPGAPPFHLQVEEKGLLVQCSGNCSGWPSFPCIPQSPSSPVRSRSGNFAGEPKLGTPPARERRRVTKSVCQQSDSDKFNFLD